MFVRTALYGEFFVHIVIFPQTQRLVIYISIISSFCQFFYRNRYRTYLIYPLLFATVRVI